MKTSVETYLASYFKPEIHRCTVMTIVYHLFYGTLQKKIMIMICVIVLVVILASVLGGVFGIT